jgi:hypothetical protein
MESKVDTNNGTSGSEEILERLKGQIEYYLGDENLKKDKFFHEKISNDVDGFVELEHFMNCNKIKKMNATKENVVDAIKKSFLLELNKSGDKVRRVGNQALPELKYLNKKTNRPEDEHHEDGNDKEAEQSFDPVILQINADKTPEFKWKAIQVEFKNLNPHLNVVYLRFNNDQGHIGVYNSNPSELNFSQLLEIDGVKFTIKNCEGDDLINFWKDHGSHFELCVGKNKKPEKKGKGGRNDRKRDPNLLRGAVTLGDETYTDLTKIKSRSRRILTSTKDGDKISAPDHDFLSDILKYHRNFEDKGRNLSHFTTGKPRDYDYSRCFYIVRTDNSSEDFSVHKCIETIGIQSNKKK